MDLAGHVLFCLPVALAPYGARKQDSLPNSSHPHTEMGLQA